MAGSRLPNYGTIFSRMTGLLNTGAVNETPIWYTVMKKIPPPIEPDVNRPLPPQNPIPEIIYEDDLKQKKMRKTELS